MEDQDCAYCPPIDDRCNCPRSMTHHAMNCDRWMKHGIPLNQGALRTVKGAMDTMVRDLVAGTALPQLVMGLPSSSISI